VFFDEVLNERDAMAKDDVRPLRSGPNPPLAGAALRARPSWRYGMLVSVARDCERATSRQRYFFATDGASVNIGQPAPVAGRELSSR
jgi:hypothetical protein